jgi:hypothetical protein
MCKIEFKIILNFCFAGIFDSQFFLPKQKLELGDKSWENFFIFVPKISTYTQKVLTFCQSCHIIAVSKFMFCLLAQRKYEEHTTNFFKV